MKKEASKVKRTTRQTSLIIILLRMTFDLHKRKASGGSKVICGINARKEREPGNEASTCMY